MAATAAAAAAARQEEDVEPGSVLAGSAANAGDSHEGGDAETYRRLFPELFYSAFVDDGSS